MFLFMNWFCVVYMHLLRIFLAFLFSSRFRFRFGRRKTKIDKKIFYRRQPKPEWVRKEVMRLKALMPDAGCRTIANTFNRRFAHDRQLTVSKTFANETVRKYKYEIQILRKKIKNGKPKDVPKNIVWGMYLSGKTDTEGNLIHILGMVEHKSRISLGLTALKDKASITNTTLLARCC